jgi:hypothetical protein
VQHHVPPATSPRNATGTPGRRGRRRAGAGQGEHGATFEVGAAGDAEILQEPVSQP